MENNAALRGPCEGEGGSSIPETLLALAIVSLSLLTALGASSSLPRIALESRRALVTGTEILRFDRRFRGLLEEVIIPYWEQPFGDAAGGVIRREAPAALEIPWYRGRRENTIALSLDAGGRISVLAAGDAAPFTSPEGAEAVEIVRSGVTFPGIRITWSSRDGKAQSFIPLGGGYWHESL
ncbi:MAG: hypothetical protein LBQ35_06980 [Spirochaetaceae bacterium]|jgi:hypothetical protein|nr:hypothetical protein [Spirochaetaceae bacterium]